MVGREIQVSIEGVAVGGWRGRILVDVKSLAFVLGELSQQLDQICPGIWNNMISTTTVIFTVILQTCRAQYMTLIKSFFLDLIEVSGPCPGVLLIRR